MRVGRMSCQPPGRVLSCVCRVVDYRSQIAGGVMSTLGVASIVILIVVYRSVHPSSLSHY